MANTFHLAIPAGDLHNAIYFYCHVLGCTKGNSEINPPDSWCDINFWGNELTLHASTCKISSEGHNVDMGNVQVPHFGVHLEPEEFKSLKERLDLNEDKFNKILLETGSKLNIKGKNLFFPLRITLFGEPKGPDLPSIFSILGVEKTLKRLKNVINE